MIFHLVFQIQKTHFLFSQSSILIRNSEKGGGTTSDKLNRILYFIGNKSFYAAACGSSEGTRQSSWRITQHLK